VLLVSPVDPDEGSEVVVFLVVHVRKPRVRLGQRDMRNRAQRRQYGEPVRRLSLRVRYGLGTPAGSNVSW
jgi:hypothetical protein